MTIWFRETARRSLWNIGLGTSQLQHLMLSQIIYVEPNLASDFDTSDGCHLFFNDNQPQANLCYPFRWLSEGSTFVFHSPHAKILWLRETARASWRSPCCCTCWCFGDYLRGRRAAPIGQRKITQCAHRELWERPVLPGAALRRNWPSCGQSYDCPSASTITLNPGELG